MKFNFSPSSFLLDLASWCVPCMFLVAPGRSVFFHPLFQESFCHCYQPCTLLPTSLLPTFLAIFSLFPILNLFLYSRWSESSWRCDSATKRILTLIHPIFCDVTDVPRGAVSPPGLPSTGILHRASNYDARFCVNVCAMLDN
jgi:hypothetical protein